MTGITTRALDVDKQESLWGESPSYVLKELELYNWGGFSDYHRAVIDVAGTAIIGPTGSGKTTLVDALMTLLVGKAKYNLASTGGHESDRDLVSYVRGVSGPGDGGAGQSHIARAGRTVTGIAATLSNGSDIVRLGTVLSFDGSSSSPSDMKKAWVLATSSQQSLSSWLTLHQEGGMRALKQLEKTETGIWVHTSKAAYLAQARDVFEVRDNAFNLLNRAAGLKQLNSIDDIFRELVLDDTSQFVRAREVINSFDDLTAIHEELETARRQQRTLEPVKIIWEKLEHRLAELEHKRLLKTLLPAWFGEQAYQLWKAECERLEGECTRTAVARDDAEERYQNQQTVRNNLNEVYLSQGGANLQTLEDLIEEKRQNLARCQRDADQYQLLAEKLGMPSEISRQQFMQNKAVVAERVEKVAAQHDIAEQKVWDVGSEMRQADETRQALKNDLHDAEQRPDSNIPGHYQHFRAALAGELGLTEQALPFVAELVQVHEDETAWRGAIERAIGAHRLRIMVPPDAAQAALRWINQRHNALHVRIVEIKEPDTQPQFMSDGFTRKLDYKQHPYREAVKALLAGIDRHCVDSPEALRHASHAMTQQGLMSGRAGFFDKQDQKRLSSDWQTGFNNHDRLDFLKEKLVAAEESSRNAKAVLERAKNELGGIKAQKQLLDTLIGLDFDQINAMQAEHQLSEQQEKLAALTSQGSSLTTAKEKLAQAEASLKKLDVNRKEGFSLHKKMKNDLESAESKKSRAFSKADMGMNSSQRERAQAYFPVLLRDQLDDVVEIERQASDALYREIETLTERCNRLEKELVKQMSDAQKEDRGALSDVGRELEDVLQYLDRLRVLTEEALPEKRKRFTEYLNRSSDDGVTQLLHSVDNEVDRIEERLEDVNNTLRRVDFQPGRYLQLVSMKVVHDTVRVFGKAKNQLASSRFVDDEGESHYKSLQHLIALLRDACDRQKTIGAKALLDPRFRLEFKVSVIERADGRIIETRSGSQGGSGGEKEIIASYVLTASLSYALCPDGSSRPLFGTIVLDEAFSRSSHAVAGRIIAALKEFGLHALFITPNKEMKLLRKHTRSAVVVHRRGDRSSLTPISWQELDEVRAQPAAAP